MTEREKKYAWGVGIAAGLAACWFVVNTAYISPRSELDKKIETARAAEKKNGETVARAKAANIKWSEMQEKGLNTDPANTASSVQNAIYAIADRSRVQISNWQESGRPIVKDDFTEAKFKVSVSANANQFSLARFLYDLEHAPLPARIEDMDWRSKKPDFDDLSADFTIVAVAYTPKPPIKTTPMKDTEALAATARRTAPATRPAASGGTSSRGTPTTRTVPDTGPAVAGRGTTTPSAPTFVATEEQPDPPLPEGPNMEERLKRRRVQQLQTVSASGGAI